MAREHLPPDSAWHRAQENYHQWGNTEALLWMVTHLLERLDARLVWQKRRKPKWPKFKPFPWVNDAEKVGDRTGFTDDQVMDYLMSKAPEGSEMRRRWLRGRQ